MTLSNIVDADRVFYKNTKLHHSCFRSSKRSLGCLKTEFLDKDCQHTRTDKIKINKIG